MRLHKAQFHIDMTTLLNEGVPIPEDVLAGVCQTDAGDDEDVLSSSSRETAHHMIEELMLLANRLVAEKLYNSCLRGKFFVRVELSSGCWMYMVYALLKLLCVNEFVKTEFAVLRYHPTPKAAGLRNLERFLAYVMVFTEVILVVTLRRSFDSVRLASRRISRMYARCFRLLKTWESRTASL